MCMRKYSSCVSVRRLRAHMIDPHRRPQIAVLEVCSLLYCSTIYNVHTLYLICHKSQHSETETKKRLEIMEV